MICCIYWDYNNSMGSILHKSNLENNRSQISYLLITTKMGKQYGHVIKYNALYLIKLFKFK